MGRKPFWREAIHYPFMAAFFVMGLVIIWKGYHNLYLRGYGYGGSGAIVLGLSLVAGSLYGVVCIRREE